MTKECENCEGAGVAPCVRCDGTSTCDECDGTGVVGEGDICPICGGSGDCQQCHGSGGKDCPECDGEAVLGMTGLRSCPFCGGWAYEHTTWKGTGEQHQVRCSRCGASSAAKWAADVCAAFSDEVRDKWNSRDLEDSLYQRVIELGAKLDGLTKWLSGEPTNPPRTGREKAPLDLGSSKPRRTYPERKKGPINTGDEPDADQVWNAAIYAAMDAAHSVNEQSMDEPCRTDDEFRVFMRARIAITDAILDLRKDSK